MSFENLTGRTLGQYQLRELLGVGGMGTVYRAWHVHLKVDRAIKVLPFNLANSPGYLERFNREAEIAASLEHPSILPVIDFGSESGLSYVVMRLLTGGTLNDRLRQRLQENGALPSLAENSEMLDQLASALDYAHAQGVVHRDIKASNIMFDNQGRAYLVDFGIAKLTDVTSSLTGTGMTMGTPSHMAPEQWKNEQVGAATDQYALGVVVYSMITGRVPFEAPTPYQLMSKHLNELPTPPHSFRAGIPESVTLVLNRALAKQPADRFPTTTAFAQAFAAAIEGFHEKKTDFFSFKVRPQPVRFAGGTPSNQQHAVSGSQKVSSTSATPDRRLIAGIGALILTLLLIVVVLVAMLGGGDSPDEPDTAAGGDTETPAVIVLLPTFTEANILTDEEPTVTLIPSDTPTEEASSTIAATDTPTDEPTPTDTATVTPTVTDTQPPTVDPVEASLTALYATATETARATARAAEPTETVAALATMQQDATETADAIATAVVIRMATDVTWTPTNTATHTPSPTPTSTATYTPTQTPTNTATSVTVNMSTATPVHIVRTGETVASIAFQYGVTVDDILQANGISDPRQITVGSELLIPLNSLPTLSPATDTTLATPESPYVRTISGANVRSGPGVVFDPPIGSLAAGSTVPILAIHTSGTWYKIQYYNSEGWISATVAEVIGDTSGLPRDVGPATPVPVTPTQTLTPTNVPTATAISTPDPLQAAFVPVTRNADWTPVERDFDGVTMVLVPAGCFMMGSEDGESDEQPAHEQCFDQPFWIDKYEVTQVQFRNLGGRKANNSRFLGDYRPVTNITWFEARNFCELRDSRLPTEAEWEYAARGPDNLVYPWGNEWNASNAVWYYNRRTQGTADVGSIPAGASWVGTLDMSGNIWEWTSSLYGSYPYSADDGREADTGSRLDVRRMLRGGSWGANSTENLYASTRSWLRPDEEGDALGFRCARSYDETSVSAPAEMVTEAPITTANIQPEATAPTTGSIGDTDGVDVFACCDDLRFGMSAPSNLRAGAMIDIWWDWYASTEQQVQDHIEAASYEIRVNGELIPNINRFVENIRPMGGQYATSWYVPYGPLEAGIYEITYAVTWNTVINDGVRSYGPGTNIPFLQESCTISVSSPVEAVLVLPTTTPIPEQSVAVVNVESANLRSGPGTNYTRVGSVASGTTLTIIARTSDSEWYLIEGGSGEPAWIWAGTISLNNGGASIEVAATIPAAPPTRSPDSGNTSQVTSGGGTIDLASIPVTLNGSIAPNQSIQYTLVNNSDTRTITLTMSSNGTRSQCEVIFVSSTLIVPEDTRQQFGQAATSTVSRRAIIPQGNHILNVRLLNYSGSCSSALAYTLTVSP